VSVQPLASLPARCEECGREAGVEAHATGWLAFRVDLDDDPDPPEVVVYCLQCSAREFGEQELRE
jgi:hypothetical protein